MQRNDVLDFRSDTVTRPTAAMRAAMAAAPVGDDVFGEDPTINALEAAVAARFGREAALFVPTGTMANLVGIGLHCERGDEVLLERRTHSFSHEVGGAAALLGALLHPLDGADGALLTPAQVEASIRSTSDVHQPRTRLVIVENTANAAGGLVFGIERLEAMQALARARGLRLHMDGARIWHAAVASGVPLARWGAAVDTLSCCLSKGLGCPLGSLVVGDRAAIDRARRLRKMLGGGMRQAGIVAAAGLYALDHHVERLAHDHAAARALAAGLAQRLPVGFDVQHPETNMVFINAANPARGRAMVEHWATLGILAFGGARIRLVTHLDLPPDGADEALRRLDAHPFPA